MATQIKYTASAPQNSDIAYIIKVESLASVPNLSEAEKNFAQTQIDGKGNLVFINRYDYKIYLVIVPEKKSLASYQEELRKAGNGLQKVLKADKVKTRSEERR